VLVAKDDLDILVRPALDNAAPLLTALAAFGFSVPELPG
jgi:hypothetical protein